MLPRHEGVVVAAALDRDGRRLVTGSYDTTARVWDLADLNAVPKPVVLPGGEGATQAATLSADGRRLVTGSEDGTLRFWDLSDLKKVPAATVVGRHQGDAARVPARPRS